MGQGAGAGRAHDRQSAGSKEEARMAQFPAREAGDMKLAADRPTTQSARIYKLEERMDALEPKVREMHEILIGLRSIGRAARLIVYWFGGPSVLLGAGALVWRALH
jgi:hypothetical protein